MEEEIDYSWIDNYNNIEKKYDKFYKTEPTKIRVFSIFLDKNIEAVSVLSEKVLLDEKCILKKNNLLKIIEKNKQNKKYSLYKMFKYNIIIDPLNINKIITDKINDSEYMNKVDTISDIKFYNTIKMFHTINSLFLVFNERVCKSNTQLNKTKRSYKNKRYKTQKLPSRNKHT